MTDHITENTPNGYCNQCRAHLLVKKELVDIGQDIAELKKYAREDHQEMWKNIKAKMSLYLGLWIFGAVLTAMGALWAYSEDSYQRHQSTMESLKYETNERIHQIQLDAAEIKASLKRMEKR